MDRIIARNLKKVYIKKTSLFRRASHLAIESLELKVKNHNVLSIIGKNGAGKTSVVKMLSGVMKPTSGMVLVDGENPFLKSKKYRKRVTLILGQKGQMDVDISIMDNALYFASIYGLSRRETLVKIENLAKELEVEDYLNQQVRTLSMGQKMKGEFLIAFLHTPSIIFLDEPTLGLDYMTQKKLRDFLNEYKMKHDAAIVLTSHNIDDIEALSDAILILDQGKKLFEGTIQELKNSIEVKKTISFRYEGDISRIPFEVIDKGNQNFVLHSSKETEKIILEKLLMDFSAKDIRVETQNLNEIIEQLYKKNV